MNILKQQLKNVIVDVLFVFAIILTVFNYLITIFEYEGKEYIIPKVVSSDAVIVILLLAIYSMFFSIFAYCLKRKKGMIVYIFMALMVLNIYKIVQVIIILNKVEKGILLKM